MGGLSRVSGPGTRGETVCSTSLQAGGPAAESVALGTGVPFAPLLLSEEDLKPPRKDLIMLFTAISHAPNLALGCLFSVFGTLKTGARHETCSECESVPRAWHFAAAPAGILNLKKNKK